ncbi:hypothetical protein B0H16DRAFT_1458136 [Mycena metata]|uniref:Uncharacterized protein n=1 Tax=Mycena metata TaxID=1033252 RepID=A0AAD7J491_9AGAR|nr:hypothetical protein B0H16DRAFT_1458136 [Mycena metata]
MTRQSSWKNDDPQIPTLNYFSGIPAIFSNYYNTSTGNSARDLHLHTCRAPSTEAASECAARNKAEIEKGKEGERGGVITLLRRRAMAVKAPPDASTNAQDNDAPSTIAIAKLQTPARDCRRRPSPCSKLPYGDANVHHFTPSPSRPTRAQVRGIARHRSGPNLSHLRTPSVAVLTTTALNIGRAERKPDSPRPLPLPIQGLPHPPKLPVENVGAPRGPSRGVFSERRWLAWNFKGKGGEGGREDMHVSEIECDTAGRESISPRNAKGFGGAAGTHARKHARTPKAICVVCGAGPICEKRIMKIIAPAHDDGQVKREKASGRERGIPQTFGEGAQTRLESRVVRPAAQRPCPFSSRRVKTTEARWKAEEVIIPPAKIVTAQQRQRQIGKYGRNGIANRDARLLLRADKQHAPRGAAHIKIDRLPPRVCRAARKAEDEGVEVFTPPRFECIAISGSGATADGGSVEGRAAVRAEGGPVGGLVLEEERRQYGAQFKVN